MVKNFLLKCFNLDLFTHLPKMLSDTAIKKMLATLDDPFTRFLEPEKFKSLQVGDATFFYLVSFF